MKYFRFLLCCCLFFLCCLFIWDEIGYFFPLYVCRFTLALVEILRRQITSTNSSCAKLFVKLWIRCYEMKVTRWTILKISSVLLNISLSNWNEMEFLIMKFSFCLLLTNDVLNGIFPKDLWLMSTHHHSSFFFLFIFFFFIFSALVKIECLFLSAPSI